MKTLVNHPLDAVTAVTVNAFLKRVSSVFPLRSAILFGSRARGDFKSDSDADVAVLLSGPRGHFIRIAVKPSRSGGGYKARTFAAKEVDLAVQRTA